MRAQGLACFNSRTLGRVRPCCSPTPSRRWSCFNSRTLGRVRQELAVLSLQTIKFQFTHPGKGATAVLYHKPIVRYSVSIHAPWEGCDYTAALPLGRCLMFQFTHPGKGATALVGDLHLRVDVSIHAPWEGCDLLVHTAALHIPLVSIHAPW